MADKSEGVDAIETLLSYLQTGRDAVDAYLEMDRLHPGRGWDIEAHKLRALRATLSDAGVPRGTIADIKASAARARPKPIEREFKDVHEKAEFYRKLFEGQ